MLNKFTYQLELNNLNQCTTKSDLKSKISTYNRNSFSINAAAKVEMYLPWYTSTSNQDEVQSKLLYYDLLQLAIAKYAELYDITELPNYAQHIHKFKINIILKE